VNNVAAILDTFIYTQCSVHIRQRSKEAKRSQMHVGYLESQVHSRTIRDLKL